MSAIVAKTCVIGVKIAVTAAKTCSTAEKIVAIDAKTSATRGTTAACVIVSKMCVIGAKIGAIAVKTCATDAKIVATESRTSAIGVKIAAIGATRGVPVPSSNSNSYMKNGAASLMTPPRHASADSLG